MRVAIVSDIHGNLTAFEAVLADLRETSPDFILHGGDLADAGASPVEIVDRIRDLGWPGIAGNTDEMLFDHDSLTRFAAALPQLRSLFAVVAEMADATRALLGDDRIAWLRSLPRIQNLDRIALVHAGPADLWRAPASSASDADLQSTYGALHHPVVIYGHIHHPYVRELAGLTIANSGSVGLPYDGDRRASYILLDDSRPIIRRVEYDIDRELKALAASPLPHADWIARTIQAATPQMP